MTRTCENPAPNAAQLTVGGVEVVKRKLDKSMMFFTTEERAARLKQAAKILESAGVDLEAGGHTGLLNEFIEKDLREFLAAKLTEAGLSKAAVKYELEKLK